MDPDALLAMIFVIILMMLTGGFILLFPIARRLGQVLERRLLQDDRSDVDPKAFAQLREAVRSLEGEVRRLNERQEFVESLIRPVDRVALPPDRLHHAAPVDQGGG
ncbi:MAG: hypothetical protein ACREM1_21235 [Longimicrobiales bacterium]